MRITRANDLLNTLALTIGALEQEGIEVRVSRNEERPGWTLVMVRAHLCPRCHRMTPGLDVCGWCKEDGTRTSADERGGDKGNE